MKVSMRMLLPVGAAVALAGCWPFPNKPQTTGQAVNEMEELGTAMAEGKPVRCTMTAADGKVMNYYADAGRVRVEGMQTGAAGTTGYMINDGAFTYTWEEGAAQGMKFANPTEEEIAQAQETAADGAPDVPDLSDEEAIESYEEQGYSVDCQPGAVDDSLFVPPSEVTFVDTAAAMQGQLEKLDQAGQGIENLNPDLQEQINKAKEMMGEE